MAVAAGWAGLTPQTPKPPPRVAEVVAWLGRPQRGVCAFELKLLNDKIIADLEIGLLCYVRAIWCTCVNVFGYHVNLG